MADAVIVATARSPIGRAFKGSLKDLRPDDLTATIVRAALDKVPQLDPPDVDDLMLGCGLPGGEAGLQHGPGGRGPARLRPRFRAPRVTRYCSSSLQTTRMAMHAIKAGEGDVFISAGVEMVSRYAKGSSDSLPDTMNPLFADASARTATRRGRRGPGTTRATPASCPTSTSRWARPRRTSRRAQGISRAEQDEFGVRSQNLAEQAIKNGFYAREITPVTLPDGTIVDRDDGPRPGVTLEAIGALKPVFRPDGTVTAGNCCPLNDGAAAVVMMSDRKARELGITPLARIVATGVSGLSPEIMGLGPVEASRQALRRAGMTISDIDLVEINEAFAAQVIPAYRELGIDIDRLNVHGGAIALGHPFGMTGARITATLLNGLTTRDETVGLETMCVGGGQGMAMIIERLN